MEKKIINNILITDQGDNNAEIILTNLVNTIKSFLIGASIITGIFYIIGGIIYAALDDNFLSGFGAILNGILILVFGIIFAKLIWAICMLFINISQNLRIVKQEFQNEKRTSLTYLISIGELEKANKQALIRTVEKLRAVYYSSTIKDKASKMDTYLKDILPKLLKMGIILPEYVQSGERFIDYMNNLTGNNVSQ